MVKKFFGNIVVPTIATMATMGGMSAAIAACTGTSCTNVSVERIYPTESNYVQIRTSGTETNLDCTPSGSSNDYIRLYTTHANFSILYALLLAGFENASTDMNFKLESGTGTCVIRYIYSDK